MELGKELFEAITTLTPIVNVDLLIKDESGRILLSWRDDEGCGKGWHVPGGIVRLKETLFDRVKKVIEIEIEAENDIVYEKEPISYNELILTNKMTRGHFIAFLYECFLSSNVKLNSYREQNEAGYLQWFEKCPDDLIEIQKIYNKFFKE